MTRRRKPATPPPPTAGWWGDGPPPWDRWPGVSLRLDATWSPERARWESTCGLYYFDPVAAVKPDEFMSTYLKLPKSMAGKPIPFALLDWQRLLIVWPLFGWKRVSDGLRRFRRVFCEVGKKNGKSALCSGLGLYLFSADDEFAAEVYAAAGDEEQAKIVWGDGSTMAEASPDFLEDAGVEVLAGSIVQERTKSFFKAVSSKAATKHGFNIHALIFDELHTQKSRTLYETLKRGVSARRQPVTLVITTAGDDRESICYEEYNYAKNVRDGVHPDEELLPVVFEMSATDDWKDERSWHKANPSLAAGAKSIGYMRSECLAAQNEPRKRNDFLRLELNVWTESRTVWITPEAWAACKRDVPEPADLPSLLCCLGLDLSETTDLTALVAAFRRPDERPAERVEVDPSAMEFDRRFANVNFCVDLKAWFWIPEEAMQERCKRDGVPYDLWARQDWLRVIPGSIIDNRYVARTIMEEIMPKFRVHEIGFDKYNARQLAIGLIENKVPMVEVPQTSISLSAPSKLLEGLVRARRITHDGNPVLKWCFANAEVLVDSSGNIKPVKPGGDARGTRRIDGVIGTVNALSRMMIAPEPQRSVYSDRGVQVIGW